MGQAMAQKGPMASPMNLLNNPNLPNLLANSGLNPGNPLHQAILASNSQATNLANNQLLNLAANNNPLAALQALQKANLANNNPQLPGLLPNGIQHQDQLNNLAQQQQNSLNNLAGPSGQVSIGSSIQNQQNSSNPLVNLQNLANNMQNNQMEDTPNVQQANSES